MRLRPLIALLLLLVAFPSAASAAADQESTFQDDNLIVYGKPAAVAKTLDELKALGVDRLRVSVFWAVVAPEEKSQTRPAFDAADPAAYPRGNWDRYDTIVRLAAERGLAVNFNVTSPAPFWATGSLEDRPDLDKNFAPDAAEFGAFVRAVGTRYSGSYVPPAPAAPAQPAPSSSPGIAFPRQAAAGSGPLPRVDYWTVWNEPNQPGWLTPQWVDDPRGSGAQIEASPHVYRGLVDQMYAALVATGHGRDTVLIGETAPKGQRRGVTGPTRAIKPGRFIRQLYCLDDNLQFLKGAAAEVRGCPAADQPARMKADHPALFASSGYAHHPYELTFAPTKRAKTADDDDYTTANLAGLSKLLRRVYQRYAQKAPGGGRDVPLYLTEYGYQTPPDKSAVSFTQQAAYLNEAEWLTYRNPRVRTLTQFLLVDDGGDIDNTFQSGLTAIDGKAKPALLAYQLPIFLPQRKVKRGRKLRVFGLVRPAANGRAPKVQVQLRRPDGSFKKLKTVTASAGRGYVDTMLVVRRSGVVRLAWTAGGRTLTSRQVSYSVR